MRYEYNGNLIYEERVALVSKEIMNNYPFINKSEAILISTMEEPITSSVTDIIKFRRLYNILIVKQDTNTFDIILNDMLKLDKNNKIIQNGILKLLEYRNNNIFPSIEEIFN